MKKLILAVVLVCFLFVSCTAKQEGNAAISSDVNSTLAIEQKKDEKSKYAPYGGTDRLKNEVTNRLEFNYNSKFREKHLKTTRTKLRLLY